MKRTRSVALVAALLLGLTSVLSMSSGAASAARAPAEKARILSAA